MSKYLEVKNLTINFPTEDGIVHAVDNLSFSLEKGKTLGIVGESGSGKSVTSLAILGLQKGSRAQVSGEIWVDGKEIVSATEDEVRKLRGQSMAMIFQDPLSALHPFYTIGAQLIEAVQVHHDISDTEALSRAAEMLTKVGIPSVEQRLAEYPHQLSGGMRQRVMIAMALINEPELLIADEPTTALDVTVQAQILNLMKKLQRERGMSIHEGLIDACHKRARPIVMTTIAMGAGMLPIATGFGAADPSFRQPMAVAVIGGLITSTFLSLLVIPAVYLYVDDVGTFMSRMWGRLKR